MMAPDVSMRWLEDRSGPYPTIGTRHLAGVDLRLRCGLSFVVFCSECYVGSVCNMIALGFFGFGRSKTDLFKLCNKLACFCALPK